MSTQTKIDMFFKTNKNNNAGSKNQFKKIKSPDHEMCNRKRHISLNDEDKQCRKIKATVTSSACISSSETQNIYQSGIQEHISNRCSIKEDIVNTSSQSNQVTLVTSPKRSPHSGFTPKKNSRITKYNSPKKVLNFSIDQEKTYQAIENLNLVKQGSIRLNEFNLEEIYATRDFVFEYGSLDTKLSERYDIKDIVIPQEKHADHLFMAIVNVFYYVMNCGYFNCSETDTIFSVLTLPAGAQMLLARMLKRKHIIQRIDKITRLEDWLKQYFPILTKHHFLTTDIENEDLLTLLNLLHADEIQKLSKIFKVNCNKSKNNQLQQLIKIANKDKSLFPGATTPSLQLRKLIINTLGTCVRIPHHIESIFDRIFTLLMPPPIEPSENIISDIFLTLTNVEKGEIIYPTVPDERYPVFRNREHLLKYVESKNVYNNVCVAYNKKDWETVKKYGDEAYEHVRHFIQNQYVRDHGSNLPVHVHKFLPIYTWVKILFKSINVFKKLQKIDTAEKYLLTLLEQKIFVQTSRGKWLNELSIVQKKTKKFDFSADLLLQGLQETNLTEVDIITLLDRVKILTKLNNGISEIKKKLLKDVMENIKTTIPQETFASETIFCSKMPGNDGPKKSIWSVEIGTDKGYMNVERVVMEHYKKNEFDHALHCEGSLPVTLFTLVFWDELYNINVPGAFVSLYQDAPLDLFTPHFFKNRCHEIKTKIDFVHNLDPDKFINWLTENFSKYRSYKSPMTCNLFNNEEHFMGLIKCMGKRSVLDICDKLLSNFRLWRAGFPDLIVWNPVINKYKIVEVKGPNDTLSVKQRLWLHYLKTKGIYAELCHVKDLNSTQTI